MKYLIVCVTICCIFLTEVFAQDEMPENVKPNSVVGDFGRSLIGTYIGVTIGAGIGGYWSHAFYSEERKRDDEFIFLPYFPGLFLGASIGSAFGSSLFLHLSKNREVGYWKLVKLTLIPSLISSIPVSLAAAFNENDKNIQVAGLTTLASVGVTLIWAVVVYRNFSLRATNPPTVSFGQPHFKYLHPGDNRPTVFIKIAEVRF